MRLHLDCGDDRPIFPFHSDRRPRPALLSEADQYRQKAERTIKRLGWLIVALLITWGALHRYLMGVA